MRRAFACGALVAAQVALSPLASAQSTAPTPTPATAAPAPASTTDTRGAAMAAYHAALAARRLGATGPLSRASLHERLLEAQELASAGRRDEVIAKLVGLVESPRFADFADSDEGRAAVYVLGDALASAGAYEPARGYLGRLLPLPPSNVHARRAVRRLVEIALESGELEPILADLAAVPAAGRPEETSGEIAYLTGRKKQLAGDRDGALAAFATVTQRSRFWASAVYLSGLLEVDRGDLKRAESLFCQVADPNRSDKTAPFFADERFFAVRDLARLALGRVAHEQFRFDDARYYYYLVPQDSDRLAEALYESATSRYEKKDYEGARALLDELGSLGVRHRYEDEAWVLAAYIDLARCKFDQADGELRGFLARYQPVRDAVRALLSNDTALARLLDAARAGGDAATAETGLSPESARSIAALVRLDASWGALARRLAQLDVQMSGLRGAMAQIDDLQRTLATTGGVRPAADDREDPARSLVRAKSELDGLRAQLETARRAHADPNEVAKLKGSLDELSARVSAMQEAPVAAPAGTVAAGKDLPDLLHADRGGATELYAAASAARAKLVEAQEAVGKDALARLDLRLSRLLRRARLGRIESVLGRKRALEVEVEALAAGVLPQAALDSLAAARYLRDDEEYWPFEGDDWPDEYVGGEGLR